MSYLMLINIGPVQDFIASARRSRDLWFGSHLLSELSKAAAGKIVEFHKRESLIFPAILDPNDLNESSPFNAANKILAKVEKPEELAGEIYQAIQARLSAIRQTAFEEIGGKFDQDLAVRQVEELIEFSWAAVKFGNEKEYAKKRAAVEYLAAARKNTRDFKKIKFDKAEQGEVPKSALDGRRESVIPEYEYKKGTDFLWKNYRIREKERLCGVGLLKRHGNKKDENKVVSTSHIAALPFLQTIEETNENREAVRSFKETLRRNGIDRDNLHSLSKEFAEKSFFGDSDGHLLYIERMRDYFDKEDKNKIQKAQQAVEDFFKAINRRQSELSPYYALLLADGDNMGKAIDAQTEREGHRQLSEALSEFARDVIRNFNNDYDGSLIYAGGDDVLGFVPLHRALDCARNLAEKFEKKLQNFKSTENIAPTLSVGIAVAHHIEPLSDALELARKAEKAAKAVDGKNALAIIADKRSGTSRIVKGGWQSGFYERIKQYAEWHSKDQIPDGAAYQLRDLANRLEAAKSSTDEKTLEALREIKKVEAGRILRRKQSEQGAKKIDERILKELILRIENVSDLAEELIVAKIFAQTVGTQGEKVDE